jgi:hypothetical protein
VPHAMASGILWQPVSNRLFETRLAMPTNLTISSPFSAPLSAHFRLGEFALNRPERRFTQQHQIQTAGRLADFLETVRATFGGPVVITSGYRPWSINQAVGGARYSEHLFDAAGVGAVDFYIPSADLVAVERWIDQRWPFSLGLAAASRGFIHLGMRQGGSRVRWNY